MTRRTALVALLLTGVTAAPAAAQQPPAADEVRQAVCRAVPLIEKGSNGHMEQRTCFACHNQAVPVLALVTARSRGFPVAEDEVQANLRFIATFLDRNRSNYLNGWGQGGQVDTAGYALWTLQVGGWKPDQTTAAVTEYLLVHNQDRDHWTASGNRPPSELSPFTTTYLAVHGLHAFGTPEQKERIAGRLCSVGDWLARAQVQDTEDRVFRLRAVQEFGCPTADVQAAAADLIRTQRPDGGWAQRDGMESDAYATGTALVALHQAAALATEDAVYQRGMRYLLATQLEDGSWHVRSRSKPFQAYFESGFPHGKDQFISLSASGWATTALALALPPVRP
jgi:hypothetical protein